MEVIDTGVGIKDPENGIKSFASNGRLEFENVTFSYEGAQEPTLKNISFETFPGEITAIIGSTGSGKSTLANLIPRFYDVGEGRILIDGIDIREMSQETLRRKIGFVPQKPVLFSGSITQNILMGKDDANLDEIESAARVAQAEEFISAMNDGYEHMIDQGGVNLSGGQKQRLCIARALVRRPEIYIFDDSFSALDFKTDAKLRAALRREVREATVIIIAQRVGTVMNADRIIVLNEGRIEGIGKHSELIKSCDVYKEIVISQLDEEAVS
jgi:ATP-binding cassette subfamily B protein